ncbi:MAG: division/cell wall cluster transcriptional repressor MraZ [Candidatus Eremiobacteraeota bacterium]|nr:division/cell wall cluster transcriptional repressor MraZ [Candidatus Eremiobacteraeota bacterium]
MGLAKFTGEFEHTLDDKSRLIIPSKFRTSLGDKFYLLRSVNADSIWIMPETEFNQLIDEVSSKISQTDVAGQKWLRLLVSSAVSCVMENQGRVLIPQKLKEIAGIRDAKVTLIGAINHIEVWSTERWKEQEEQENFIDQTQKVYEKYGL